MSSMSHTRHPDTHLRPPTHRAGPSAATCHVISSPPPYSSTQYTPRPGFGSYKQLIPTSVLLPTGRGEQQAPALQPWGGRLHTTSLLQYTVNTASRLWIIQITDIYVRTMENSSDSSSWIPSKWNNRMMHPSLVPIFSTYVIANIIQTFLIVTDILVL